MIPAIDLMAGEVVRLTKGMPEAKKVYSSDPLKTARDFKAQGAELIHIVDLDAALGQGNNFSVIQGIVKEAGVDIEVGGGIRTLEYAQKLIDCGVKRIVVSTKAFEDRAFLEALLKKSPDQVALSLDVKDGRPAINGWKHSVQIDVNNILEYLERVGLNWLIYTDISRDGTLQGVNCEGVRDIKSKIKMNLIASGGVARLEGLKQVNSLGVWGVIVGKAFYEKTFTLKQAIEAIS